MRSAWNGEKGDDRPFMNRNIQNNSRLLKPVILSVSLVTMMNNSISTVLGNIKEAFPEAGTVELQCLVTFPMLTMTIFILVSGVLVNYLGSRKILLTGLFIYTISGTAPAVIHDFRLLLFSRLLLGLGLGLFFPLALGLITDFYEGEERINTMGQQFAVGNMGQTFALLAAGLLAVAGWRHSFLIYGLGGAIFILVLLFLPEPQKTRNEKKAKTAIAVNRKVLFVMAVMGFYNMVYITMFSNLSLVMKSHHIGTALTAGCAMSFMTFISMCSGMFFGKMYGRWREAVGVISGLAIAGAFGILISADNVGKIYAALILLGFGNAWIMPYGYYHASRVCSPDSAKFCLALTQAVVCVGSFVSPFAIEALKRLLSLGGERFPFAASLAGMCMINLLLIGYWIVVRKKGEKV